MNRRPWMAGLALLASLTWHAAVSLAQTSTPRAPSAATVNDSGVRVSFATEPRAARAGEPLTFRFSLRDATTHAALTSLRPAAWLAPRAGAEASAGPDCVRRAATYLGGSLTNRPALDLNEYYVLALNDDPTVSVVDPRFGFGGSQLLAMVKLESRGEDWALTPDGETLFVSMPDVNKVAAAETMHWTVRRNLSVGTHPTRVALQPDGARVWVVSDEGVTAVDVRSLESVARIDARNVRDLTITDDSRWVVIASGETSSGAGTLIVASTHLAGGSGIERANGIASSGSNAHANTNENANGNRSGNTHDVRRVALPFVPRALAFSATAGMVYAGDPSSGAVAVIDIISSRIVSTLTAVPGFTQLRVSPGGRHLFLPNPEKNVVQIVDVASNRFVRTADVTDGPDQITFSDRLAYIRRRGSDTILMLPLEQLATDAAGVSLADFTGGQHAMGRGRFSTPADSIVRAPDGIAVLVANPADRAIYYYKEGMAAPMGGFNNYSREPRAVLVVDRSLRERPDGVYETTLRVDEAGRYDAIFFLDSPRVVTCFALDVAEGAEATDAGGSSIDGGSMTAGASTYKAPRTRVLVEPIAVPTGVKAGTPARVRFRLSDVDTHAPVGADDVAVLAMRAPGVWQRRVPARALGDGSYEAEIVPPVEGVYYLWVTSATAKLPVNNGQFLMLRID